MVNHPTMDLADRVWAEIIKHEQNCLDCGDRCWRMEAAHIIGRGSKATRYDLDNGVAMCLICHHKYTAEPAEWEAFIASKFGQVHYDALLIKSNQLVKANDGFYHTTLIGLRATAKQMGIDL